MWSRLWWMKTSGRSIFRVRRCLIRAMRFDSMVQLEAALSEEPALLTNFRKHTGLYVYRREVLLAFARWPQSELERLESLEQLRALEHGVKIKAIKASTASIGVDTMADLERVRSIVEEEFRVSSFKFRSLGQLTLHCARQSEPETRN